MGSQNQVKRWVESQFLGFFLFNNNKQVIHGQPNSRNGHFHGRPTGQRVLYVILHKFILSSNPSSCTADVTRVGSVRPVFSSIAFSRHGLSFRGSDAVHRSGSFGVKDEVAGIAGITKSFGIKAGVRILAGKKD